MKNLTLIAVVIFSLSSFASVTPTGIKLDTAWKVKLNEFALKHVSHQSWGYSHAERNYHNTMKLAELEGITVDEEVLFAAAFLHDVGGLPEFEVAGVDHGVRSVEVGVPLLREFGFPEEKIGAVREIIIEHVYYGPTPTSPAAKLFRDADILDFLGPMGVSRILAANLELGATPNIKNSITTITKLTDLLPSKLQFPASKKDAEVRIKDAEAFLQSLKKYSFDEAAY